MQQSECAYDLCTTADMWLLGLPCPPACVVEPVCMSDRVVCLCVCACVCARVRACVCAYVCCISTVYVSRYSSPL